MDIAATIEYLIPSNPGVYMGSCTANTEAVYDKLRWIGPDKKPTWAALQAGDTARIAAESAAQKAAIDKRDAEINACNTLAKLRTQWKKDEGLPTEVRT